MVAVRKHIKKISKPSCPHEYLMQKLVYEMGIVNIPKPIDFNKTTNILSMAKLDAMNISDLYGEEFDDVPGYIIEQIREIIEKLYNNHIIFPDITGYNFMIDANDKIWIIDFEHAHFKGYSGASQDHDDFVKSFIFNPTEWNSEFK